MRYSKFITIALAAVVCTAFSVADVGAQSRGRAGGGHSGGGRGPTVGHAVPRGGGPNRPSGTYGGRVYYPAGRAYYPRGAVGAPLRSYYYPYYGHYGYGRPYYPYYRPGFAFGVNIGFGYPYYGYYGYPAYGYSYGGYYPYGWGSYGYAPPVGGYAVAATGGIRIQGAPRNAQVFVDGSYAGVVDDFDGTFQRLSLEPGAHTIEIRAPGLAPMAYDVNVQPGQTVTIHANVR